MSKVLAPILRLVVICDVWKRTEALTDTTSIVSTYQNYTIHEGESPSPLKTR